MLYNHQIQEAFIHTVVSQELSIEMPCIVAELKNVLFSHPVHLNS